MYKWPKKYLEKLKCTYIIFKGSQLLIIFISFIILIISIQKVSKIASNKHISLQMIISDRQINKRKIEYIT